MQVIEVSGTAETLKNFNFGSQRSLRHVGQRSKGDTLMSDND